MSSRLEGKVTLITGTAGGQGAAAARLFAAEGAIVVGCDLDAERAEAVASEVRAAGGAMTSTAPVDLADPDAASAWVDGAAEQAGGSGATFIEQSAHGAAKGGVLAMTRHLAASGAPHGIRANSISPGLIVTPQIEPFLDERGHPVHEMLHAHPLGRLGRPDDVARVALFLASEDAAYLNAVDIVVDGGQSLIS